MTAITDITKVWNILYVDKGARIRNGLSIGIDYASNPGTWVQYDSFGKPPEPKMNQIVIFDNRNNRERQVDSSSFGSNKTC